MYPTSKMEYGATLNDNQVAGGMAMMEYDESSGQAYLTTGGDLLGATFYPWTAPGYHDEWHEVDGMACLYGGGYSTLALPAGYEFVPEPGTLALLAFGILVCSRRRR
jgi:hypothetical protein